MYKYHNRLHKNFNHTTYYEANMNKHEHAPQTAPAHFQLHIFTYTKCNYAKCTSTAKGTLALPPTQFQLHNTQLRNMYKYHNMLLHMFTTYVLLDMFKYKPYPEAICTSTTNSTQKFSTTYFHPQYIQLYNMYKYYQWPIHTPNNTFPTTQHTSTKYLSMQLHMSKWTYVAAYSLHTMKRHEPSPQNAAAQFQHPHLAKMSYSTVLFLQKRPV